MHAGGVLTVRSQTACIFTRVSLLESTVNRATVGFAINL